MSKLRAKRKTYHHGDLRAALITAALEIAEESGPAAVTVREAARRAGVSPAAPFRHFPSRQSLMSAVGAEALRWLAAEVDAALAAAPDEPVARFRALGLSFIRWAYSNPTHFEIATARDQVDFEHDPDVVAANSAVRRVSLELIEAATRSGKLQPMEPALLLLTGRALVYGLARMMIDGHMPRWGVPQAEMLARAEAALDLFITALGVPQTAPAAPPRRPPTRR